MAIRIGAIELVGLQEVYTEDTQALTPLRGAGQAGGIFQDLGREPLTIVMRGVLFGADPQAALEELRQAQQEARPLPFAAAVIAGAELTDVLILDLRVRQLAGTRDRYAFFLRVCEHNEPPEAEDAGVAAVDDGVEADAAAWSAGAAEAAAVLEDPSSLADAVDRDPSLLANLDDGELGEAIAGAASSDLDGARLGGVLAVLGERDPAALGGALAEVAAKGRMAALVDKLAAAGGAALDRLRRLDLASMLPLVLDLVNGTGVVKDVQEVIASASALMDALAELDPAAILDDLADALGGEG